MPWRSLLLQFVLLNFAYSRIFECASPDGALCFVGNILLPKHTGTNGLICVNDKHLIKHVFPEQLSILCWLLRGVFYIVRLSRQRCGWQQK